jgi:hypothetical protein
MTFRTLLLALGGFHALLAVVAEGLNGTGSPHSTKHQDQNKYQGNGFLWQASLDSDTGRASSLEVSLCHSSVNINTNARRLHVRQKTLNLVESWPQFLSKPTVTFGLIGNAPVMDEQSTAILLRPLMNLSVLSFGKVRMGRPNSFHRKNVIASFELPVSGGLLSLPLPFAKDRGHLSFVVERIDTRFKSRNSVKNSTGGKNSEAGTSCIRLRTAIAGSYSPWVAGKAPIPAYRKWTYLSSQSLVHGYTMWRFHRAWKARMMEIS